MTNFDELKAAIARWLNRDDLSSDIPLFIQFAEATFNRRLRTLDQEIRATTTMDQYIALPTDWAAMRNIQVNANPVRRLRYMPPDGIDEKYPSGVAGPAQVYTIADGQIQIGPIPTDTEIEIIYYSKIPPLATNGSNWLLTKHPDLYLLGSLVHAEGRIGNDPRIAVWKSQFEMAMNELISSDSAARWSGGGLTMTVG